MKALSLFALALTLMAGNTFAEGRAHPAEYGDKVTLNKPVSVEYAI